MTKHHFFTFLIVAAGLAPACHKPEPKPEIDYFITVTESDQYDLLILGYAWSSAYIETIDGNAKRSIYLPVQEVLLRVDGTQEPVFLGASEIEAGLLTGFQLYFSSFQVEADGLRRSLLRGAAHEETAEVAYERHLSRDKPIRITYVVDVDASIVPLPSGEAKFVPKVFVLED
jgi:hypothetical protein